MPGKFTKCPFYASTAHGWRCILMSPEDWRSLSSNGRSPPCLEGGSGCPIRARLGRANNG